jgi:beta-glucosidase
VLTVPVANTGKQDGTEIVQVYIKKVADPGGPVKTLRAFKRINVAAGQSTRAVINLPFSAFEFYDEMTLQMAVTPGEYELWYGNSSAGKDLKMTKVRVL